MFRTYYTAAEIKECISGQRIGVSTVRYVFVCMHVLLGVCEMKKTFFSKAIRMLVQAT